MYQNCICESSRKLEFKQKIMDTKMPASTGKMSVISASDEVDFLRSIAPTFTDIPQVTFI